MSAPEESELTLAEGLLRSRLAPQELWLEYVGLGGEAGQLEVEAYALGLLQPSPHQHNLIAQALNEQFLAVGADHPVAYLELPADD